VDTTVGIVVIGEQGWPKSRVRLGTGINKKRDKWKAFRVEREDIKPGRGSLRFEEVHTWAGDGRGG